ncbi:MAG: L,D-transpeptidase ErfK/SrfK, partial [Thermoleophilaceae bacterium]|nr:L,D-transpeptidase ErfK/SrfK [Thermoleophilaceae bacterium]
MKQRSFIILAAALAFLFIGVVGVYAYDSSNDDQIADGVRAGGVDIGGMSTSAARAKVKHRLEARLNRPLYAVYHGEKFKLTPAQARIRINADAMVDEALHRSRDGNILSRTWRGVTGGKVKAEIAVRASYSKAAVAALVKRVSRTLDRSAQDASLSYDTGELRPVKAKKGREVKTDVLAEDLGTALSLPDGDRTVPVSVASTRPKVTTKDLAKKYGTVVAVNRNTHRLTLLKRLHVVKAYPIAVGMQGLETPAGQYPVQDKQVDPWWHVPNSAWAGKLAGHVIPPGPADPLKARWIGITGGAGIHGTIETASLGSNA